VTHREVHGVVESAEPLVERGKFPGVRVIGQRPRPRAIDCVIIIKFN
jgi:hypothetical protein